jgi:hypothetical protein
VFKFVQNQCSNKSEYAGGPRQPVSVAFSEGCGSVPVSIRKRQAVTGMLEIAQMLGVVGPRCRPTIRCKRDGPDGPQPELKR